MRGSTARLVVSVLLLGVALTASARLWQRSPTAKAEPVRLPYDLQSISQSTVAPDAPPEATWSYLAKTLCGGEDLYSDLMNAAERGLEQGGLFRKKLPALLSSSKVKSSLACGKALAAAFPREVVEHSVAFGKPTRWLSWLARPRLIPESALALLPPPRSVEHLALVRCTSEAACSAQVPGSGQWLSGSLEDLRAFSAALPDSPEPSVAQAKLLATLDDGKASLVHASSSKDALLTWLWGRLRFEPMPNTSKAPERIALAAALDKHLEFWSLASKGSAHSRFELVGHDERAAVQLEQALTAYVGAVLQSPQVRRPYVQNTPTQWREPALYQVAENRARAHAWREAKIERDGKRVTFVADAAVSDNPAVVAAYETWHENRAADAARIVRSLADGNAPGEAELRAIGGDYLLQLARGGSGEPPESPYSAPPRKLPPPASGDFYSLSDLQALGLTVEALDAERTLLCGDGNRCVCLESLECGPAQGCLSFDKNIAAFERALAGKNPGMTVFCEVAETGRCGDVSYFDFRGDIHRRELRWFNASGRLIAQRNWTDYPAYCGGRANARWLGIIPYCSPITRERVICGAPARDKAPPIDDLLETVGL